MWIYKIYFIYITLYHVNGLEFRLGMLSPFRHPRLGWENNAAAATIAIETAQRSGILVDHNVSVIWRDDKCSSVGGAGNAVLLRDIDDVDVFIGPPCSASTQPVGQLASFWNFPIFSQASTDPVLEDKTIYKTLIRLGPPFNKLGRVFVEIFNYFQWKRVVMISRRKTDNKRVFCDYSSRSNEEVFRLHNITLADWIQIGDGLNYGEIDNLLLRIRQRGRIVILCSENIEDKRNILLRALSQGMMDGTYVYFTPDHLPPPDVEQPWIKSDGRDQNAMLAFMNVFQITVAEMASQEVENFRDRVSEKMADPPWNYNYTLQTGLRGLAAGVTSQTGDAHSSRAPGLTFEFQRSLNVHCGITGNVIVDENGDRDPDYWMWDLQPGWTKFQQVLEVQMTNLTSRKLQFNIPLIWHTENGQPPRDTPKCGFYNELCIKKQYVDTLLYSVIGVTIFVLVVAFAILIFLINRRRKFESELQKQVWIIPYEDISMSKSMGIYGSISLISFNTEQSSVSKGLPSCTFGNNQVFTCIGIYKGTVTAVRKLDTPIVLQRSDHLELKMLKELNHDNINKFIGICIDERGPCMLTSYCSKGSLQDIIENEDIKLDWMFKLSLITDLVNGMQHIHNAKIVHGSLKSSNCLVDNRWVLKVTDFGLNKFKSNRRVFSSDYQLYRDLFWTAPECIRKQTKLHTREGDVYSFAVILYEVLFRTQPYDTSTLSPKEIIKRVCQTGQTYRPTNCIAEEGNFSTQHPEWIYAIMKQSWDKEPYMRPSFSAIKSQILRRARVEKVNIVDNMILMLEKYANNLEEIVEQRTEQLIEEKKKTDTLLHSMLPPVVADRLKTGKTVDAEIFDAVTIFFSDIVGFTSLSAVSTPIEIVAFLNDLYTTFDSIIRQFDVYKVETIGDAYMVASGLPLRNGDRHVAEIANMSLKLLESTNSFKIKHRPNMKLQIRIGMHTGMCAAGVVGRTMPRYCLFGDTVNMASRMESNGEALKIHVSESSRDKLLDFNLFELVLRGEIEIKGKGLQKTYWLLGLLTESKLNQPLYSNA